MLPALSNIEIDRIFSGEKRYLGTFAKNVIPKNLAAKEGALIINMNNNDQGGSHWTLIMQNKKNTIYFDSFGVVPSVEVLAHMKLRNKPMYYVDRQLQDLTSSSCGWFCMYFIDECIVKKRDVLEVLLDDFTYDPNKNEKILRKAFLEK
jgi:hypothetical protein